MRSTLRILNLEDNVNDTELNKAVLLARWSHCELICVDNRKDFVAALEQGDLDIILSDYSIPGFDGRRALELAREKCPEVPFLYLSGTIGDEAAVEALKNGTTDYVLKHRSVRLIPAIERALREVDERAECQRAEETMRQSEHKYRELFESLGDAAFLADEQSEKIIDTNRRAEELLDCKRGEILGRKQSQFLTLDKACTGDSTSKAEAPATSTLECELIRTHGGTVPVEVRATRLTLYGRKLVLRVCHELTERRRV